MRASRPWCDSPRPVRTRGAAGEPERWTDGRKQEHRITRTTTKTHLAAPPIGVLCITSEYVPREPALSDGGALLGFSSVGGVNWRHEPLARPRSLSRLLVWSDHGGVRGARRGSLARRRVVGASRNCRARSTWPGCSGACAIICPTFSVIRVVGLVSNGLLRATRLGCGSRWRRHRAAWWVVRIAVALRTFVSGQTQSGTGVTPSVAGERPECFTCQGSGFAIRWRRSAPLCR